MSWRRSLPIASVPCRRRSRNLLFVVRMKVLAMNAGVEAIGTEEGQLLINVCAWRCWIGPRFRSG